MTEKMKFGIDRLCRHIDYFKAGRVQNSKLSDVLAIIQDEYNQRERNPQAVERLERNGAEG